MGFADDTSAAGRHRLAAAARISCFFALLCFVGHLAAEETAYITDQLKISLRSGQSADHRILRVIPSGTEVSVLQRNPATGYSQIKLKDGVSGWILTRYLVTEPGPHRKLEAVQHQLKTLQDENQRMKEEINALKSKPRPPVLQRSPPSVGDRGSGVAPPDGERLGAGDIRIPEGADQLQEDMVSLSRELKKVQLEKHALESAIAQDRFLTGAGVLFGGILIGLLLPRLRWRRRPGWESF